MINVCGLNISYIQKGEGKNLVLLHGYLAQKEVFIHQINYLSKFYKVTAFDFAGFGQSSMINYAFSVSDYAILTKSFLEKLGIEKAYFIAHSFGARVLFKMCENDQNIAQKIILTGAAGLKPKFSLKKTIKILHYKLIKRFLSPEKRLRYGSSDYKKLPEIMRQSFVKIVNEDLLYCLKYINCPTLIIFGENDKQTPVYMAKKLQKNIKNSKLIILKNCGHFAFLDRREYFNSIAKSFFYDRGKKYD